MKSKQMKCILSMLLTGVLSLTLVGCNTGNQEQSQTVNNTGTSEPVGSGVSKKTDNSVDEAYIKSMFTDEQINKEGIELNQLPADYHFVTMADLCAGRCTAGEKVYTVGIFENGYVLKLNGCTVNFVTATDYKSLNLKDCIGCIYGEYGKQSEYTIGDGEIVATGDKAIQYLKKYSDKEIAENYKLKCEDIEKYIKVADEKTLKELLNADISDDTSLNKYGEVKHLSDNINVPLISKSGEIGTVQIFSIRDNGSLKCNGSAFQDIADSSVQQALINRFARLMLDDYRYSFTDYERSCMYNEIKDNCGAANSAMIAALFQYTGSVHTDYIKITGTIETDGADTCIKTDSNKLCRIDNLKYSIGDKKLSNGDKVTVYGTFGGISDGYAANINYVYAE